MAKRGKKQRNATQLNKLQQGLTVDPVDKEYGYKIFRIYLPK